MANIMYAYADGLALTGGGLPFSIEFRATVALNALKRG